METIKINTTQNVSLSYSAAGIGPRILAGLLDAVFIFAYTCIIFLIFSFAIRRETYSDDYESRETYNQIMIGILILFLLPAGLYHLLCETFLNGQSFGKKIVKIKVIKLDGTQPNFGSYLIRSIFRLIDQPMIALITIAVTKHSQRFGDMVAGTTVILMNRPVSIKETILHQQKPDYKIVYSQVALMSDFDANTIREVLDFSFRQNQPQHLAVLSKKIRGKYGIPDVKQKDKDFLETLLMDYTNYQFER
ncbi:MAG: RDD family protein [Bacteroidia bacterium]